MAFESVSHSFTHVHTHTHTHTHTRHSSSKGKGPAQRKYSLRSSGSVAAATAAASTDTRDMSAQSDGNSGTLLSAHAQVLPQSDFSMPASSPSLSSSGGEGQGGGACMHRTSEVCEPRAPRKRKQGMPGLVGVSGDPPVMAALDTPPPQQAFNHQLPNGALAVGSGICPPPPFIMAAPVVILSPSAPVPTITATQPRIIPHHTLPRIEQSPFPPRAASNFAYNSPPPPQRTPMFSTGFHGNTGGLDPFNSGVIHLSPPSYTRGVPSLLQAPSRPLLTYARGNGSLLTTQTSSVPEDVQPTFPREHMPHPHQGGRRQGVALSLAEHEHMMQQLDQWQEGGADTPTHQQQHPIPSSMVSFGSFTLKCWCSGIEYCNAHSQNTSPHSRDSTTCHCAVSSCVCVHVCVYVCVWLHSWLFRGVTS